MKKIRTKRNSKTNAARRRSLAPAIITVVLLCVVAAAVLWICLARPTLEGAVNESTPYTDTNGVACLRDTETQKYYSISVEKPDVVYEVPTELAGWLDAHIGEYRELLNALLESRDLDSKDPASLKITLKTEAVSPVVTCELTAARYISAESADNLEETAVFICDFEQGKTLTVSELFTEGCDYLTLLSQKLCNQLEDSEAGLAAKLVSTGAISDESVIPTATGIRLTVENSEAGLAEGAQYTVSYTDVYKKLAIAVSDEFKPVEPTPIDPQAEKVIALTFDDGPHGVYTPALLDLLDEYNARATFFVVGYNVKYHPDVIREIVKRGHTIAIHSTDHKNLTKMTDEQVLEDIDGLEELIFETCGVRPYIMRPMGGAVNQHIADLMQRPAIIWDIDPQDWKYRDAEKVSTYVLNNSRSGDIVLSHDIYKSTYEAYKIVIPALAEQGYRFVTVTELLGIEDPEIRDAYAGKIVYYRSLSRELREAGAFE